MTLPASGAISMSQIATELGIAQTGINLNQANVRALAGIGSGTISLSDFYGKAAAAPVSQFSGTAWASIIATKNISVSVIFNADGTVSVACSSGASLTSSIGSNWYLPATAGIGSSYYIRATLQSGDTFTGLTSGAWTLISGGASISLSRSAYGSYVSNILVEIAATSGGTVLASGTIQLRADSEP